jgi:hypothetical protein
MTEPRKAIESADLVDAIAKFRVAFLRENMKPPTTIILADHDEGMRFLSMLIQMNNWTLDISKAGKPVEMADGSVYMEVEIMGMAVRWPANRIAMRDGSWRFA